MKSHFAVIAFSLSCLLLSSCGGGGGSSEDDSSLTLVVDGTPATITQQGTGVDAQGNSFVMGSGSDSTIEIRFPGTSTGTFTSGGRIIYTDASGTVFEASDEVSTSTYTITVTIFDSKFVEGSYSATLVGPDGGTLSISGSFKVVFVAFNPDDPYGGTYIGIFEVSGQAWDSELEDWKAMQRFSFQVTIELKYLFPGSNGTITYEVSSLKILESGTGFFNCPLQGCGLSMAMISLPDPPGTPVPNGESKSEHTIMLDFTEGELRTFATQPAAGDLYTSTDGRILSNSLTSGDWVGSDRSDPYVKAMFGEYYNDLNPATRSRSWTLTKSAL
jgi:hypothetical protein